MERLSTELWESVRLTIELASVTTVIMLLIGTPLAWWLARSKSIWSGAAASIITLPLLLLPPVLGFYLLALLGSNGPGGLLASLGRADASLHLRRARGRLGFVHAARRSTVHPQGLR